MMPTIRVRALVLVGLLTAGATASAQDGPAGTTAYARAELLRWRLQDSPLSVPLLTTTDAGGTRTLLGGQGIDLGTQSGGRFTGGAWFDPTAMFGVEASAFFLERASRQDLFADDTGSGRFALPYLNALNGAPSTFVLSAPGSVTPGRVVISDREERIVIPGVTIPGATALVHFGTRSSLFGGDVIAVTGDGEGPIRFELLAGFRYLALDEEMVLEASTLRVPAIPGDQFTTTDLFKTRNDFYGPQAGVRFVYSGVAGFAELTGKAAAGTMIQQVDVAGALRTTAFGAATSYPGGVFSQRSNLGTTSEAQFAVVSELQAHVGFQFGPVRGFAGYSFLYASSVARPGNQIDPVINPNQSESLSRTATPAGGLPAAPVRSVTPSSFWAQGVNFGLELRY